MDCLQEYKVNKFKNEYIKFAHLVLSLSWNNDEHRLVFINALVSRYMQEREILKKDIREVHFSERL